MFPMLLMAFVFLNSRREQVFNISDVISQVFCKAAVCWQFAHHQTRACSYSTLIYRMQIIEWQNGQKRVLHFFFIVNIFSYKTSFIFALTIFVNFICFSSIHCCFVYLHFRRTCFWLISALKEQENMNKLYVLLFFSFRSL